MEVAEHHLDVSSAAEEAGRLRAGVYRSIWTRANPTGRGGTSGGTMAMIKPHWKFSRYLEGYGDLAEPLKRYNQTMVQRLWGRHHHRSSRRERELPKQHNAEVEAGV